MVPDALSSGKPPPRFFFPGRGRRKNSAIFGARSPVEGLQTVLVPSVKDFHPAPAAMTDKIYLNSNELTKDSFRLAKKIYDSGFNPDVIIGLWRGGTPVGIAVHEFLHYKGVNCYHTAVKTSSYTGIDQHGATVIENLEPVLKRLTPESRVLIVDDIFDTGMTVNALVGTVMKAGIPREDIKVAVYDYKVPLYKNEEPLPIQPDYWCRKHILNKPEDSRWIHYTCHEFIGLEHDEIDEVYKDPEVRDILHTILEK